MSQKRILWLMNHTTLRKFEAPLLIGMGYELFCPKVFGFSFGDYSCSITYEYDHSLSLPPEVLKALNQIDLYKEHSPETLKLINTYFQIVFCPMYIEPLVSLIRGYKGVLVLHAFGLTGDADYTHDLFYSGGAGLLSSIKAMGNRFWFAPAYSNIAAIESPLLKGREVYLPIGIKDARPLKAWEGGDQRILFVSPKIKVYPDYQKIYEDFCDHFGDIPHMIAGAQPQPVPEDPTVTGFQSDEAYAYTMKHCAAMYYHSQNPRHIHFHPAEAIKIGMPLVYMAGGMLDHLGGKSLPGRCQTTRDAYRMLKRLSAGDKALIKSITRSQEALLVPFSLDYCKPFWETGMERIESAVAPQASALRLSPKKKRIAIILPCVDAGGLLAYSLRFALVLNQEIKKRCCAAEIIFAYPQDAGNDHQDDLDAIRQAGIPIRRFNTLVRDSDWEKRFMILSGYQPQKPLPPSGAYSAYLFDGYGSFRDCDYAIFTTDARTEAYPLTMPCPFAVVVHDYLPRYMPQADTHGAHMSRLALQHRADRVLIASDNVIEDALQYVGLQKSKVIQIPWLIWPPVFESSPSLSQCEPDADGPFPKDYFIWVTSCLPQMNLKTALLALVHYYQRGGNMDCVVCGQDTRWLKPSAGRLGDTVAPPAAIQELRTIILENDDLKRRLHFVGDISKSSYLQRLQKAAYLFHPGFSCVEETAIIDAAAMGTPALASAYPPEQDLCRALGINACWCNGFNAVDMGAAIKAMEVHYNDYRVKLPSPEALGSLNGSRQAERLYAAISAAVSMG